MGKTKIPDSDYVSRYVGGSKIVNNRITGSAFELKENETALSVNWLEYFSLPSQEEQIEEIRKVFNSKGYTLGASAKFVALNSGRLCSYVKEESPNNSILSVQRDPVADDPSHSGIFGIPEIDNMIISEIIAELVSEENTYPARP